MTDKKGLWTQHIDPNTGRPYYYNVAYGRSYWTLPEDCTVIHPLNEEIATENDQEEEEKTTQEANNVS
ncbi:hypothetical protein THRCLA_20044 [Thraustotheca clavata]|uniref:WW domain-containing protein n=1 Tax=Thraustotheca clavata TaxID=74557 RepID=A0A1W0AC92_9STRA|nr:hypothetical protein THRCLA_20044 [Thraustotheca clavata]